MQSYEYLSQKLEGILFHSPILHGQLAMVLLGLESLTPAENSLHILKVLEISQSDIFPPNFFPKFIVYIIVV